MVLDYFEAMPTIDRLLWLMCCLSVAQLGQFLSPLRAFDKSKRWAHIRTNVSFLMCSFILNALFSIAALAVISWGETYQFGLLYLFDLPVVVAFFIALLVFDVIAQYGIHYCLHKYRFIWCFHRIHHSDTEVSITTGTRHHPVDYCLRELAAILAIIILGAPLAFYVLYRLITIFCTFFTHANMALPARWDAAISNVFVSPNMHKFHHHIEQPLTDTNFGNIFSFWDRLFGTFYYGDVKEVTYGLDVMDASKSNGFLYQLKSPWIK